MTLRKQPKPKPCPFCGEMPEVINLTDTLIQVYCVNMGCPVHVSARVGVSDIPPSSDVVAVAVQIWNTRKG